jgi:Ca2+-binding RTX toxin-like protein
MVDVLTISSASTGFHGDAAIAHSLGYPVGYSTQPNAYIGQVAWTTNFSGFVGVFTGVSDTFTPNGDGTGSFTFSATGLDFYKPLVDPDTGTWGQPEFIGSTTFSEFSYTGSYFYSGDDFTVEIPAGIFADFLNAMDTVFNGSATADYLDGSYIGGPGGDVTLNGGDGGDTFFTSYFADTTVLGGAGDDLITLPSQTITVTGAALHDSVDGGAGNDQVYSYAREGESFTIRGGDNDDFLVNGGAASFLFGDAGNDTVGGGSGNDSLEGGSGSDAISGGDGNDTLVGGAGADSLSGGNDIDTVDYSASALKVTVNLLTGTGTGGDAAGDTLSDIENAIGSASTDKFVGSAAANQLDGGGGADTLGGGDDADTLVGGAGTGKDSLDGGVGNDSASGGDGNDTISGAEGADTLIGEGGGDSLAGGDGADSIRGGAGIDGVGGGNGKDNLFGDEGADMLTGGGSADSLTGGVGPDTFRFTAASESGPGSARDWILDFSHADADKINVSAIDANTGTPDDQAFSYIGNAGFSGLGVAQLRWQGTGSGTLVQADINGNGTVDLEILLTNGATLVANDFVL